MWVSKHWIAASLTNYGAVYFVEPFRGIFLRGRGGRLRDFLIGPRIRKENDVNIITMSSLPGHYSGPGWYRAISRLLMGRQMRSLDSELGKARRYILTFDYRSEPLLRAISDVDKTLYYAIDIVSPKNNDPWWSEQSLIHFVDEVLTTSDRHRRRLVDGFGRNNISVVPHGVDFKAASLSSGEPAPSDIPQTHPIIGYTGTIHDRYVDFDIMHEVALARPGWSFVFIGPMQRNALSVGASDRIKDLISLPNVYLLGQKPYQSLPQYIARFDACIMPYVPSVDNEPFKTLNYFAQGKPVVATDVPGVSEYRDLLYTFNGAVQMIDRLERALAEPPSDPARSARAKYARDRDFPQITMQILDLFGLQPK